MRFNALKFTMITLMIFIIQAKKFLKGDWLKRLVFEPNLKYLHVGFHFHGNRRGRVLILKTWREGFMNERECRLLEFRVAMSTFR